MLLHITRLATLMLGMTIALSACNPTDASNTKIDSGRHITPQDEDTVPGVASIGGCTATIVSDTTLVTAAHCIDSSGGSGKAGQQVCASNKIIKNACTSEVYYPTKYVSGSNLPDGKMTYDVAVAIFKPGTFKYFFKLNNGEMRVGDKIFLVGYSQEQCDAECQKSGPKRWGRNTIRDVSEITLITNYNQSADGVAVSPGDSGGPLFADQCLLAGAASRMTTSGAKKSLHTNLTYKENRDFMRSLESKGAYYCGVTGEDSTHCPSAGQAVRIADGLKSATGEERFPCAPAELANGGGIAPPISPDLLGQLFVRLDPDSSDESRPKMQFAVPRDADTIVVCEDVAETEACIANMISHGAFSATGPDSNGRKFVSGYQVKSDLSSNKPMTIVVKRKNGEITASKTIRFSPIQ